MTEFEPKKKPTREGSFVRKKLIERLEYISKLEPPDVNSPGVLFSNEGFMMIREACGMAAYELLSLPKMHPVIYCKDCVHWKEHPIDGMYCAIWNWINSSTGLDFCSFAEKRPAEMMGDNK
jgi:hypothetical protein